MEKIGTYKELGHTFDMYGTIENPLFLASEIGRIIDYSIGKTGQMLECVDESEKLLVRYNISLQRGGNRKPVD